MDDSKKIIESLKQELRSKEENIYLAATYGKQLLCEKVELRRKEEELLSHIEALKQEKHSLQLSIDAKGQTMKVQVAELESLKENLESISQLYEQSKKDETLLAKNYQDLKKENCDLKRIQEDLTTTCNELRKQVKSLQDQVKDYQDQMEQSLNETLYGEEYQKMQNKISSLTEEKVNLELALQATQCELNQMKNKETKFIKKIEELGEEIADKDKEISTYSVLIEKSKEEAVELRGEIEILKLEQLDVNRRGNSIFGELDDRRLEVEKRYIELRDKYLSREEEYMENLVAMRRLKNQLAAAIASMGLRKVDAAYIEDLENHLYSSKREIRDLTERLIKAQEKNRQPPISPELKMIPPKNTYDHLRALLALAEKKVETLEEDSFLVRRQKVIDNGKLLEAENRLYFAEREAIKFRTHCLKLKLQLDELKAKDGENIRRKPKEEMIPGFVKKSEGNVEQECCENNKTLAESQTSKPSAVLSDTSAKLNKSTTQNDVCNTQGHLSDNSSTVDCREQVVYETVPSTNARMLTHADVLNDTSCIQQ